MNRLEEALDRLHRLALYKHELKDSKVIRMCKEDVKLLKELVDKATPKKVLNRRKSGVYVNVIVGECPSCGKFIQSIDVKPYQCECRQEIDWGDDNER